MWRGERDAPCPSIVSTATSWTLNTRLLLCHSEQVVDSLVVNVDVEGPVLIIGAAWALAGPQMPEVVHVLGVSGTRRVREVPSGRPSSRSPGPISQF
jgi:hypothetical protein